MMDFKVKESGGEKQPLDSESEQARVEQVNEMIVPAGQRTKMEKLPTAEDGPDKWSATVKAMEVVMGDAIEKWKLTQNAVSGGTWEALKNTQQTGAILEVTNNKEINEAFKKDPSFADRMVKLAMNSGEQAQIMEKLAQQGDKAREYALKEVGGPAGILIGQIEKNPKMAAACAITGVMGLMFLARKNKEIGEWVKGLAFSGASVYFGLEMFGKTDAAKKFFVDKLNELIIDPKGKGRMAAKTLKGIFEKGAEQILGGEKNVKEALAFLTPFAKDVPGMEWVREELNKNNNEGEEAEKGEDSDDSGGGGASDKLADRENKQENNEQEEENRQGENESFLEAMVDKTTEDFYEGLSPESKDEIDAFTRGENSFDDVIKSLAQNDSMPLIKEGGKLMVIGVLSGVAAKISLEKIIWVKYYQNLKKMSGEKGLLAEKNNIGAMIVESGKAFPEMSLVFATRDSASAFIRKFSFGEKLVGAGEKSVLKGALKGAGKGIIWPVEMYRDFKNLAVVIKTAKGYVVDSSLTELFKGGLKSSAEVMGKKLSGEGLKKIVEKIPKINLRRFSGEGKMLAKLFKWGKAGGVIGAVAFELIAPDELNAGEDEMMALNKLEFYLEQTGIPEEELAGNWSELSQDQKKLIIQAFKKTNEALNNRYLYSLDGKVVEDPGYKPGLEIFEIPEELKGEDRSE